MRQLCVGVCLGTNLSPTRRGTGGTISKRLVSFVLCSRTCFESMMSLCLRTNSPTYAAFQVSRSFCLVPTHKMHTDLTLKSNHDIFLEENLRFMTLALRWNSTSQTRSSLGSKLRIYTVHCLAKGKRRMKIQTLPDYSWYNIYFKESCEYLLLKFTDKLD